MDRRRRSALPERRYTWRGPPTGFPLKQRWRLPLLFQAGHQQGSFAREVVGALQIAVQERALRLGQKRARVVEGLSSFACQVQPVKLSDSLAEAFLERKNLLALRGLLSRAFARLERRDLSGRWLDSFGGAFRGGGRFSPWPSSAGRGLGRSRLGRCDFRRLGRRRLFDHQCPASLGGHGRGGGGWCRSVNDAHCGLPLGASPNQQRKCAHGIERARSQGVNDSTTACRTTKRGRGRLPPRRAPSLMPEWPPGFASQQIQHRAEQPQQQENQDKAQQIQEHAGA